MRLSQFEVDPWTGQPITTFPNIYATGPTEVIEPVSAPIDWKTIIITAAVGTAISIIVSRMLK
jgi:hypothetical protein